MVPPGFHRYSAVASKVVLEEQQIAAVAPQGHPLFSAFCLER
jgi:hypothetical protein